MRMQSTMHANEDDGFSFLCFEFFDEVIMEMRMQMEMEIGKLFSKCLEIGMFLRQNSNFQISVQINLHPFIGNDPVLLKLMPLGLSGGFCKYGFGSSNGR